MKKTASKVAAVVAPKSAAPVAVVAAPKAPSVVTLTRSTKERKGSSVVFLIPGVRGTVKVARTAFAGEPPMALDVMGSPFAAPKVTLTKEERAAIRANLTPADKARIARERANRAIARAAKLEAAAR